MIQSTTRDLRKTRISGNFFQFIDVLIKRNDQEFDSNYHDVYPTELTLKGNVSVYRTNRT